MPPALFLHCESGLLVTVRSTSFFIHPQLLSRFPSFPYGDPPLSSLAGWLRGACLPAMHLTTRIEMVCDRVMSHELVSTLRMVARRDPAVRASETW